MVEGQFFTTIKAIQTYWGGEYYKLSQIFLKKSGIIHRLSYPYTMNRMEKLNIVIITLLNLALALSAHPSLPQVLTFFSFEILVFLINHLLDLLSSMAYPLFNSNSHHNISASHMLLATSISPTLSKFQSHSHFCW